jgi:hypothetical protein
MATYNLKFNKDDSVVRHLIIGLLADLNQKLSFHRQVSNDSRVEVDVPFYYSITGDENFLRDEFLFTTIGGVNCVPDGQKADGNYDQVPRGIINITSLNVDPSKLVNKRNLGQYSVLDKDGVMQSYVAEFSMIPIVLGFDVTIVVSSQLDLFKVTEAIIKKMYRANYYNVEVGHLEEGLYRVSSEYAVPDDYSMERPVEFGFGEKEDFRVTFPLEINSFIPSFDFSTARHAGNRMEVIGSFNNTPDGEVEGPNAPLLGDNYNVTGREVPFKE